MNDKSIDLNKLLDLPNNKNMNYSKKPIPQQPKQLLLKDLSTICNFAKLPMNDSNNCSMISLLSTTSLNNDDDVYSDILNNVNKSISSYSNEIKNNKSNAQYN